jgi:hypothetical protein
MDRIATHLRRTSSWTAFAILLAVAASFVGRVEAYTITGDLNCDNQVMVFTAATEGVGMVVNYAGVSKCFSATPAVVSFSTTDRYLYLACWSDDGIAQGLLHDLAVDAVPVYSGDPQWTVAPTDSNVSPCISNSPQIGATLASRIPTSLFVAPAVGCANTGTCYGVWGQMATIATTSRWTWYNSGGQSGPNAPFQPGFNHRELLIFRLDMQQIPTSSTGSTWGRLKTLYR